MEQLAWYAVSVRSNHENKVATYLTNQSIEVFSPTIQYPSLRADRKVILHKPLFAGYIFVRLTLGSDSRIEVLKAPGTVKFIGFSGTPIEIPEDVIKSLKILVSKCGDDIFPHPMIKVGNKVKVIEGPFTGAVGKLAQSTDKRLKLVVEIQMLGRAVAVPVDQKQLAPYIA